MKGVNSYLRQIDLHCYMKWIIGQQKHGNMTKHWDVYVKMDLWTNNFDKSRNEHIQGNMWVAPIEEKSTKAIWDGMGMCLEDWQLPLVLKHWKEKAGMN